MSRLRAIVETLALKKRPYPSLRPNMKLLRLWSLKIVLHDERVLSYPQVLNFMVDHTHVLTFIYNKKSVSIYQSLSTVHTKHSTSFQGNAHELENICPNVFLFGQLEFWSLCFGYLYFCSCARTLKQILGLNSERKNNFTRSQLAMEMSFS